MVRTVAWAVVAGGVTGCLHETSYRYDGEETIVLPDPGGDVRLASQLVIDLLTDLERIDGDLLIEGPEVFDLRPLSALTEVGGSLTVQDAPALESLEGLDGLVRIGGSLRLVDLPEVEDLTPLAGIADVPGELVVAELPRAVSLGLALSGDVGGDVVLRDLPGLVDLRGLDNVTAVAGDLRLEQLPSLGDVDDLARVATVGGALRIANAGLADVDGFLALTGAARIELRDLEQLDTIRGLLGVASDLPRGLVLRGLPEVRSLVGVSSIASVGTELVVASNAHLERIDALATVALQDGVRVQIRANPRLCASDVAQLTAGLAQGTCTCDGNDNRC